MICLFCGSVPATYEPKSSLKPTRIFVSVMEIEVLVGFFLFTVYHLFNT